MTKVLLGAAAFLALLLGFSAAEQAMNQDSAQATAQLIDREGNVIGTASFTSVPERDAVRIQVEIDGFQGATEGEHAIHIHETGLCEPPDFDSANGHFNPMDAEHGLLNPEGPHAGDLPNIRFDADGNARYEVLTQLVTLDEGERGMLGGDGTALVIHENPDDHTEDSEAGDRIACGVIAAQ